MPRRAFKFSEPIAGLADLALHGGTFKGVPTVTERAAVRLERALVVVDGLGVGGDAQGLVADLEEILLGFVPLLGLGEVVGEHAVLLLDPLAEQELHRNGHPRVELAPRSHQKPCVHGLLDERM